jgi:hypothetical protein
MNAKNLSDFPVTGTDPDLEEFERYVFASMGESVFLIDEELSFVYNSLKQVEPYKSKLILDEGEIEKACLEVIEFFKLTVWLEDTSRTSIQKYFNDLLELETLPLYTLAHLHSQVYEDLAKLQALIKRYESDSFIKEFINNDEQPRNQGQKTKRDFYKRCIKAQGEISDYIVNGIKKRALQKARTVPDFLRNNLTFSFSEVFQDRPYSFHNPYKDMIQYFDYEKINLFRHRLDHVDITAIPKLERLFHTDKKTFYEELSKQASPAEIFHSFAYYLGLLPFQNDRKAIFKEMESLFNARHWIGFYALALAQVEGIFSEMSGAINAKAQASLPDKVKNVRPHYHHSEHSFDYYEYHVPTQRNKFMHAGYDEDFELKSHDLLYDIYHLLNVFMEINSPKVKIHKIHKTRNQQPFYSIAGFAEYFKLLNELTKEDRLKISGEIATFEKDVLIEGEIAHTICFEAQTYVPNMLTFFKDSLERNCNIYGAVVDFDRVHIKDIIALIAIKKNHDAIYDTLGSRESEELLAYGVLLDNYKKYLPSMSAESLSILSSIEKDYGKILKLIKNTNDLLNDTPRPVL